MVANFLAVLRKKRWKTNTKLSIVFVVYFLHGIIAIESYGIIGFIIIFLNLIKPPSFHKSLKQRLLMFMVLETTLILAGYHSITYISFISNVAILNKILDCDKLFLGFTSYIGIATAAGKKTFNLFTGPEFGLLASGAATLYASNQLDRNQKVQILDSQIESQEESLQDLKFKAHANGYEDLGPNEKILYDEKVTKIQELFSEKENCVGIVQENLYSAANVLKDII